MEIASRLPHPLEVQPLVAGQGQIKRIRFAAVIAAWDIEMEVDIPHLCVENVV